MKRKPHTVTKPQVKGATGPAHMAKDLTERFTDYPDVIYSIERYTSGNIERWGLRAEFFSDEAGEVVSMMNYHSGVTTPAQCEEVLALLEAI